MELLGPPSGPAELDLGLWSIYHISSRTKGGAGNIPLRKREGKATNHQAPVR
jgi:hypothetical protein